MLDSLNSPSFTIERNEFFEFGTQEDEEQEDVVYKDFIPTYNNNQ